jgi:hypothetical protein
MKTHEFARVCLDPLVIQQEARETRERETLRLKCKSLRQEHEAWQGNKANRRTTIQASFERLVCAGDDRVSYEQCTTCDFCGEQQQVWPSITIAEIPPPPPSSRVILVRIELNVKHMPMLYVAAHIQCVRTARAHWETFRGNYMRLLADEMRRVAEAECGLPRALIDYILLPYALPLCA